MPLPSNAGLFAGGISHEDARRAAQYLYDQMLWECSRGGYCDQIVLSELRRRASGRAGDEAEDVEWQEGQHPRGQPGNKGEFAKSPQQGATGGPNERGTATTNATGGAAAGSAAHTGGSGPGGAAQPSPAQSSAEKAASGYPSLEGLPNQPINLGGTEFVPGPLGAAKRAAEAYMRSAGLPYDPPKQYLNVDPALATRVATAFDQMPHDPDNPQVRAAYEALAKETMAQWQFVKATGLKVDWLQPGQEDPYVEGLDLIPRDARENNHLTEFPTDLGYGTEDPTARNNNPMLQDTGEVVAGHRCLVNDIFRIVHDYFGHFKEGVNFSDDGEENAWRSHAAMFSPLARGALTTETRGQASWVNHGPHGEHNRTASAADIHYAPQKIGLMPAWTWTEGAKDIKQGQAARDALAADDWIEGEHKRDEGGKFTISGEHGHYQIKSGEQHVGTAHLAGEHPFISAVMVEPEFQRQGVGQQLYEHIEKDLGRPLVPSPLGLTEKATEFWKKRLAALPTDKANELIDEAKKIGVGYGIKEQHIDERLNPLRPVAPARDIKLRHVGPHSKAALAADAWIEEDHPRGQPHNRGQFARVGSGVSALAKKPAPAAPAGKMSDAEFEALVAKTNAEVETRKHEVAAIVEAGEPVKMTSSRRPDHKALVGPDMSEPGKFRITRFDDQGPFGHTVYNTFESAVEDALREGFKIPGKPSPKSKEAEAPEPMPGPAATKAKPPSGSKRGDKARDAHQERVNQILAEGYYGKFPDEEKQREMVSAIVGVAYDYMGVSQKDVPFSFEPPRESKVGDRTFNVGGTFYPGSNRITITEGQSPAASGAGIGGLASHEVMHAKYDAVFEAYRQESERISKDNRGGDKWIMRPNGEIREEYQADYPLHTAMPYGFGGKMDELEKDDGITDYSRDWWQAAKDGKAGRDIAVNETLAEMASLDWQGMLPRLLWFKQSKSYKPFYEAIHKLYPAIAANAAAEQKAGGKFPTNHHALVARITEVGFTKFLKISDNKMMVGYGPEGQEDFWIRIDPNTNTWEGTWGPNFTKIAGTGVNSLKEALGKFKRGVDPA